MPESVVSVTEPPEDVVAEVAALERALDGLVPAKELDRNLLVATWNLRAFGGLTKSWRAGEKDTPKRDLRDVRLIAAIVARFDVVAVQEVKGDLRALRHLLKALGPDWAFTLTDVAGGDEGNDERLAFLFDTRRVKPSGLACELVVQIAEDTSLSATTIRRQFARTPYAVSFVTGGKTVILVTLHVNYGDTGARLAELTEIARWLAAWAEQEDEWRHNVIALGDFNVDRRDDVQYRAFTATGLTPAPALVDAPRTIFDRPKTGHYYDQVAWFDDPAKGPVLSLVPTLGGYVDFPLHVHPGMPKQRLAAKISDHYPLWVEFRLRGAG